MKTYAQLERSYAAIHAGSVDDVLLPLGDARRIADEVYRAYGFAKFSRLLSVDSIEKLSKTRKRQLVGLSLAPAKSSGIVDLCANAGLCRNFCVAFAGNGGFSNTIRARIAKTDLLVNHRAVFVTLLVAELDELAADHGTLLGVRLNAYSDIRWERMLPGNFWQRYRRVKFYDYTKWSLRGRPVESMPPNYSLTFSYSERSDADTVADNLNAGRNVAVVVSVRSGKLRDSGQLRPIPSRLFGARTIDGDASDDRFADRRHSIVVLRRKHTLKATSPFVVAVGQ